MNNNITKYGLIAGVSVVAYFLLFYFIDTKIMFNPFVNWGSSIIYFLFMFIACTRERVTIESSYAFKTALRTAFGVFTVASVVYYIFNYILFKLDPTLLITQKEVVIESMRWVAETLKIELPDEQIQTLRGEIRPVTIANSFLSLAQSLLLGFLLSLIVAALTRR